MYRTSLFSIVAFLTLVTGISAQSSDQNFPTPISQNEISSSIRARDVGDARLTTHYWAFDAAQGDIFVNVVTRNFSGDIDIYQEPDLRPLTKMVMFAENGSSENGRVIYMRQPGRLLLRVEGRTPNDDAATYTIKFAGSFVALAPQKLEQPPTVGDIGETGVRVNSVGTILPPPRQQPPVKEATAVPVPGGPPPPKRSDREGQAERPAKVVEKQDTGVDTVFGNNSAKVTVTKTAPAAPKNTTSTSRPPRAKVEPADPLAGSSLVIMLKDGSRSERPMSEVIRFVLDHGFLTIFAKDGSIHRIAAADVASVSVQ